MKKLVLIVFLAYSSVLSVLAQQTETRSPGSFTGVKSAEGIDVYLKQGEKESVRVEVSGTSPENVITEVSGSYLKIHMRDGKHRNVEAKVYVTYVSLDKLSCSSAGSIFSDGTIKSNNMEINASSAGTIEVSLDVKDLEVSSSSAADIELNGSAENFVAESSSAGQIDAYDLEAAKVEAEASSGASIKINVTQGLVAHASSGGSIRYRGNPDKSVTDSSSGGSVKKSN